MRFDLLPLLLSFLCACAIPQYGANDEHFCRAAFTLLFIFRFVFDSRELIVFFPDPKILGKRTFSTNAVTSGGRIENPNPNRGAARNGLRGFLVDILDLVGASAR